MGDKRQVFILKANKIHGDKYDYSKVEYIDSHTKIRIICNNHGEFFQTPSNHLNKKGCRDCSYELRAKQKSMSKEEFIRKSNKKHNNIYKYELAEYVNNQTKVKIICEKHGIFEQIPNSHMRGSGCPYCSKDKRSEYFKLTKEEYINRANNVHGYIYDYSDIKYINNSTEIKIKCNNHGYFWQIPYIHLSGCGCPKCGSSMIISKPEIEVQEFVKSLGFNLITNNRRIIPPKELDVFIPELNKAIEFNGMYWHYNFSNPLCKPKGYHSEKSNLCREKGIQLLHIREDLWLNKKEQMKEVIIKFLEK